MQSVSRVVTLFTVVALLAGCSGKSTSPGSILADGLGQADGSDALHEADIALPDGVEKELPFQDMQDFDQVPVDVLDDGLLTDLLSDEWSDEIDVPDAESDIEPTDTVIPDLVDVVCENDADCLEAFGGEPGPCLVVSCHVATSTCLTKALPDGQSCDDGDLCTEKSVCVDGACQGSALKCDDANPCTDDSCDPADGCVFTNNEAACDDGNPCTADDVCADGICVGSANDCPCATNDDCFAKEDGNLCNGFLICVDETCVVDAESIVVCDASENPCASVACNPQTGGCEETPLANGLACDDGDLCTTGDACSVGACLGSGEFVCDDDNVCTDDSCDAEIGCVFAPAEGACDDGDPCTENDLCVDGLCTGEAGPDCQCETTADCADLEDENLCNGTLICVAQACIVDPATAVKCETPEDEAQCNTYKCLPESGECEAVPVVDGKLCDDKDPCSLASECIEGVCTGTDMDPCDDGNVCTEDSCVTGEGCEHTPADGECDDANACTEEDACAAGVCVGQAITCDDENECTDDSCDQVAGCIYVENEAPCDDGSVCTVTDQCQGGQCVGIEELSCEEANPCKSAKCDPVDGCFSVNIEAECDDGSACTAGDLCVDGECMAGEAVTCDDENPCTDDTCDPESGCVFVNSSSACDDSNACTDGDVCVDGNCTSGAAVVCDDENPCTDDSCDPQSGCQAVPNSAECNDDSVCTTVDQCLNGQCVGTESLDCDDGNPCTDDLCDAEAGCQNINNNAPCDDGDICTIDDVCQDGSCQPGQPQQCDDSNPCTTDACDPADGCFFEAADGGCEDGSVCTENDTCANGTCQPGAPISCDDENPCTTDSCDPKLGCQHVNNQLACDDGNACTTDDVCAAGLCSGAPVVCDDNNACTDDSCAPESGCVFAPNTDPCDDGSICTVDDACADGACAPGEPLDCDDDNPCTSDACIPGFGCVQVNNNNACDDGDACTVKDRCDGGECLGNGAALCDDNNPCTIDSCDPATGCVAIADENGKSCDDGNDCTSNDVCTDGKCVGVGLQCDDENPCTDNKCIVGIGCVFPANTLPCDDGDVCTLDDVCAKGQCGGTSTLDCNDGNPCTDDLCDKVKGCVHINNTDACDDQNACTEGDTCSAGACIGGPPLPCLDDNPCTDDSCDPAIGCVFTNNTSSCDDGDACTIKDVCQAGICVGGGETNCDDANPCTNDLCQPQLGCLHAYNTDPCSDGNACTANDTCSNGKCISGPPLDCDDANVCTTDSCDTQVGCLYVNNNLTCDDQSLCTAGDTCVAGECIGISKICNDGIECTQNNCDPVTGNCVFPQAEDGTKCTDGDVCTTDDSCTGGLCAGQPKDCDDNNDCTLDSCVPFGGGTCVNQIQFGSDCDDGDACTTDDTCSWQGVCGGDPVVCNDYNPCTDDACNEVGECTYVPNNACSVLDLPSYLPIDCNNSFGFTPASSNNVRWALDATANPPGTLTGTCSLNFNNGSNYVGLGAVSGTAVSGFWYDASDVSGDMTLTFHSYNGSQAAEVNPDRDLRYVEISTDGFNTIAWSTKLLVTENKNQWAIEAFDISKLAGETFQVRFRFDSVTGQQNQGTGWFVEDLNVYLGPIAKVDGGQSFVDSFEDNASGWQFFGGSNGVAWAIDGTSAVPGSFDGTKSLNFNNGVDYNVGVVSGYALSPVIDLTGLSAGTEVSLLFRSWHQTENHNSYDRRYIEASSLAFTTGTQSVQETNIGQMNGWQIRSLNLTQFAGSKVRLRFRFNTVDSLYNNFKGWFVDNLSVTAQPAPVYADGVICERDVWTHSNSSPPVIWDVDATPAAPGYASADCSLNFNNGKDIQLSGSIVKGSTASTTFFAAAPADPTQKLYLTFNSYLGVEPDESFDVTTVTVSEVGGATSVAHKLSKKELNAWTANSIDISALHGKNARITFSFSSVNAQNNAGYVGPFIDDVMVRGQ